jgi:very-short-patch-repair endonuclease
MATNAPGETIRNARDLRKALTPPEARLWVALRRRQLNGLRIRRQHPIGPYVLDFYYPRLRLAIEVDGMAHECEDQAALDLARDRWLRRAGVRTLRIQAWAVRDDLDKVLDRIEQVTRRLAAGTPIGPSGHFPREGEERHSASLVGRS